MIITLLSVAIKKVMKLHDKYGTSFRFWLMHKPYIIISSGEDFEVDNTRIIQNNV